MIKDYKDLLCNENISLKEAMKQLDITAGRVLYVVNSSENLIGSVSDGDIRRGILKGISLDDPIKNVMNTSPKSIYHYDLTKKGKIKELIYNLNSSLPVLNNNNKIIDIIYWKDLIDKTTDKKSIDKKTNFVFILAGGFGTRLEPFTKILPKPLIPLGDKPILEKIMDEFTKYGFENFLISVNYKKEMIKLYLSDKNINNKYNQIEYIEENNPLGTIGSLYLAKDYIKETFVITNSDIMIEEDLDKIFRFHKEQKNILTLVGCVKESVVPYGVLYTDKKGLLKEIDEKPRYKNVINTGVYIAEPEIVNYITPNKKQDITELISNLIKENKNISVYPIFDDQWFDIGQWAEYEKTLKYFENV